MKPTKKPLLRKLDLRTETVRTLSISELGHAAGGTNSNGSQCGTTLCSGALDCGGGGGRTM